MYPPIEEDSIAITIRYNPVPILNVVAETPEPAQGETTESPRPVPNASSSSVNARLTTAPAATAAQETPATDGSPESVPGWITTVSIMVCSQLARRVCSRAAISGRGTNG